MDPQEHTNGIELAEAYHREVVGPLLAAEAPGLPFAAGRLGAGSDVLGFDDAQSRDHDWGLRLTVLVPADRVTEVDELLERRLPGTWSGLPVRFAMVSDPRVRHRVEVADLAGWTAPRLGPDPTAAWSVRDWLSLTGQSVLEVVAGPVFRDDGGELTALRERLAWYPEQLWRYLVACDWARLEAEFPDVGRAGLRGDEDGSAVIAARHVRTQMHLAHLLRRCWPPYGKWLGRSTAGLPGGDALREELLATLTARDWRTRQEALSRAADRLGRWQGETGLPTLDPATEPFFDRPHRGVRELAEAVMAEVEDPEVLALPPGVGSAEQISDHVRVLIDPAARRRLVGA